MTLQTLDAFEDLLHSIGGEGDSTNHDALLRTIRSPWVEKLFRTSIADILHQHQATPLRKG